MKKLIGMVVLLVVTNTAYASEYWCEQCKLNNESASTPCMLTEQVSVTCGQAEASLMTCVTDPECRASLVPVVLMDLIQQEIKKRLATRPKAELLLDKKK